MNVVAVKIDTDTEEWAAWYLGANEGGMEWDTLLSVDSNPERGAGIGSLLRNLVKNQVVPGDFVRRDLREEVPLGGGA